jgi:hypothetical protein
MTLLCAALDLAALGLPVFPLHHPMQRDGILACSCGGRECRNQAKHPFGRLVRNGVKNATTDRNQIADWWRQGPSLNIGIRTDDVVVLDVDPRHGGFESLAALEALHDVLPHTWTARTGSDGRHIYFAAPSCATLSNSAGRLGAGLDIRAKGGYIVAPPSKHISGKLYSWIEDPDEAPLAPLPNWLIDKLTPPPRPPIQATRFHTSNSPAQAAARVIVILMTAARAPEGQRNQIVFWAACRLYDMVREGALDQSAGMDGLAQLRLAAVHAGLSARETNLTITSALRRAAQ